jgi:hypothetical protein
MCLDLFGTILLFFTHTKPAHAAWRRVHLGILIATVYSSCDSMISTPPSQANRGEIARELVDNRLTSFVEGTLLLFAEISFVNRIVRFFYVRVSKLAQKLAELPGVFFRCLDACQHLSEI